MFLASSPVLANLVRVEDGCGTAEVVGNGGGYGWGSSADVSASANGSSPFGNSYAWGSVTLYAREAGEYGISFSCSGEGSANISDVDNSGG